MFRDEGGNCSLTQGGRRNSTVPVGNVASMERRGRSSIVQNYTPRKGCSEDVLLGQLVLSMQATFQTSGDSTASTQTRRSWSFAIDYRLDSTERATECPTITQ